MPKTLRAAIDDNKAVIVCALADDAERLALPGEPRKCELCGATVLVTPSSLRHPDLLPGLKVVCWCVHCTAKAHREHPELMPQVAAPSAEQAAEFASVLGNRRRT